MVEVLAEAVTEAWAEVAAEAIAEATAEATVEVAAEIVEAGEGEEVEADLHAMDVNCSFFHTCKLI